MRALITFSFVLFLVVSVPLLWFGASFFAFGGAFLLLVWFCPFALFAGALCIVWLGDESPRFRPSDIYYPPRSRRYRSWNSIHGWPRKPRLVYECCYCLKILPSQTESPRECGCGNLFVTPDHIGAQNPSMVRLYEE